MIPNDFFERIQNHYDHKRPFVAYRKPNKSVVKALLQTDDAHYQVSDYKESGFVFAPFDDKDPAVLIPNSKSENIQTNFKSVSHKRTSANLSEFNLEKRQIHISLVQKGIDTIKEGVFKKVVLSRSESVNLNEAVPLRIFKELLNTYETAFVYCFYHDNVGLWLGATPETLLKIEGHKLTTMALAGTQKYNGTMDVYWGQKEREEQQFVTDFIANSLQTSLNDIIVTETETVRAGNLLHLKSDIKANINPETFNLKQILLTLHPTPAVCGFPKDEAKHFILENENYKREFYTGFLGELNMKERNPRNANRHNVENDAYTSVKTVSNLYVNLRCMKLNKNQAILYVGGGVTKDSDAEQEWEETFAKSQIIKSVL